jgi:hypothetical protein
LIAVKEIICKHPVGAIQGAYAINENIARTNQPNKKRFTVRRVVGSGDLWITEYILTYDGKPSYTVSIMEFSGDKVARETQYFADPFEASTWRTQWVERTGEGEAWMPRK